MADYNTHKEFGSGDRICYHGVLDMFRNPKISAYLYQSQGSDDYLMLSSNLNIGDYNASTISHIYAFTNADEVRLYRNNELIKTYHKKDSPYPNIPNSPIIIDDFIGNLLEVKEGYSHKVAENMKSVLSATLKYGNRMPFKYKLMFLKLMLFHKVTYEVGYNLYGKYVGNWGSNEIVYKFEGVKNDKVFKTIELSKARTLHLEYTVSNTLLVDDNTYDVALVRIKAVDQNENILPYYNEPFKIDSEGTINIIGPKLLSFKGGYSGIFVKTNGNKGKGILKIETSIEDISIKFNVK
jgi:beta-galactosidase